MPKKSIKKHIKNMEEKGKNAAAMRIVETVAAEMNRRTSKKGGVNMGGEEETKGCSGGSCSCGECGSDKNPKIIPPASLLDTKKEMFLQEKTCAGCGAGKI